MGKKQALVVLKGEGGTVRSMVAEEVAAAVEIEWEVQKAALNRGLGLSCQERTERAVQGFRIALHKGPTKEPTRWLQQPDTCRPEEVVVVEASRGLEVVVGVGVEGTVTKDIVGMVTWAMRRTAEVGTQGA